MTLTVRKALVIAIGVIIAAALAQGLFSLHQLGLIRTDLVHAQRKWTPSIDYLQQISFDLMQLRTREARHILAKSPAEMDAIEAQVATILTELASDRKSFEAIEREGTTDAAYRRATAAFDDLAALHGKLVALSRAGDKDGAVAVLNGPLKAASDAALEPVQQAIEATRVNAAGEFDRADASYGVIWLSAMVGLGILLALGGGAVAFAIYGISKPIAAVAAATAGISDGRLDTEIPYTGRSDEIGVLAQRLLTFRNKLRENERLQHTIEQDEQSLRMSRDSQFEMLRSGADMLGSFNELSVDMTQLSHNTNKVKARSSTIASASAEMVASVEEIARSSEHAAREAGTVNASVRSGLDAVRTVTESMANIAISVDETASSVDDLTSAAAQIGHILAAIESIASQTNLLALNATIESARAGEAGRGFAVVASEVKQLAGQTGRATEDIAQRIAALRGGMDAILGAMTRSKSAVDQGRHSIREAGTTIETIAEQVGRVAAKMGEISDVLNQQKAASQEISQAIVAVAQTAADNEDLLGTMADKLADSNDVFSKRADGWHKDGNARSMCEVAKIDHIVFKKRVVDTVMGRQVWAAADVPDHHCCRFGKWYDTLDNREISRLPAYAALATPHEQVHALARSVLTAFECQETTKALSDLEALANASQRVVATLDDLSSAIAALDTEQHAAQVA